METISTGSALLNALKLEDTLYSMLPATQEDEQGRALWNIPGFGVLGLGSATVALVTAYLASPSARELLSDAVDVVSIFDEKRDQAIESKAEEIGKRAEKYVGQAPEAKAPLADVKPIEVKAPPHPDIPDEALVNRMANLPGVEANTSGAPFDPKLRLARPSAEIRSILQNTAKLEGVDFGTLYALAGAESSFTAGATARNSSATGLFQFTAPTWNYLVKTVYPELGYAPGDRLDPKKSAVVAARYIKNINGTLSKKLGAQPTIGQTYLGYFMGPTGASRFLDALQKDSNAKGADLFPQAASANPYLFYAKGDKSKPLTLRQTMDQLEGKVIRYYKDAQVQSVQDSVQPVTPDQSSASAPMQIKTLPAQATPQVQSVAAPDFSVVSPKNEERVPSQPSRATPAQQAAAQSTLLTDQKDKPKGDPQYFRDRNGRLLSLRG